MILQFDFAILDWIQANLKCDFLDFLMPGITLLGEHGIIPIVIAVIFILMPRRRIYGITMLSGMGAGLLFVNLILKNIVARPRPCWINTDVAMLIAVPTDYSFPSCHTMHWFIAATVLMCYEKKIGIPFLIAAILMAFSRMYLYVHFLTDVAAGALIGIAIGLAAVYIAKKVSP